MKTVSPIAAHAEKRPVVKIRAGYPKKSQLLISLAWADKAVSQKFSERFPSKKSLSEFCFLYEREAIRIRTAK